MVNTGIKSIGENGFLEKSKYLLWRKKHIMTREPYNILGFLSNDPKAPKDFGDLGKIKLVSSVRITDSWRLAFFQNEKGAEFPVNFLTENLKKFMTVKEIKERLENAFKKKKSYF